MWGKIIGAAIGWFIAGPFGLIAGLFIGHQADLSRGKTNPSFFQRSFQLAKAQSTFFESTFLVMGHIAKADGRVSESEIQVARLIMQNMRLTPAMKRKAIDSFNRGKQPGFNLTATLKKLRDHCANHHTLMQMFVDIQMQAAYADGQINAKEKQMLQYITETLGFKANDYSNFNRRAQGERAYHRPGGQTGTANLKDAYRVLGVTSSADDAAVKKAYRKLMSQYHPDKLMAKGLPEEMMKLATQKTQEIKAAYDQIRKARGL